MKKIILLIAGFSPFVASAQWTTSGTNIYNSNTGVVGIGTGTTFSGWKFEVVGNGTIIRNPTSTSFSTLRLYNNQNSNVRSLDFYYTGSSYSTAMLSGGAIGETASITTSGAYPLMLGTAGAMRMFIGSTGDVGIGTSTPGNRLDIAGTTTNRIGATVSADVKTGFRATKTGTNASDWEIYVPAGSTSFRFYNATLAADLLTMTTGGNVGIGTTAPNASYKLDVNGGINATSLFLNAQPVVSSQWTTSGSNVYFNTAGNVGIGTANPNQKLTVNGIIYGKEIKVDLSVPGPDYVFEKNYHLTSLKEVKAYIDEHKHLPEVPSAAEMEKNGIGLSEMNMILLKKVEELTLHLIELENRLKKVEIEGGQIKKGLNQD